MGGTRRSRNCHLANPDWEKKCKRKLKGGLERFPQGPKIGHLVASKIVTNLLKTVDCLNRIQALATAQADLCPCSHSCDIYSPAQEFFNFLLDHFTPTVRALLEWNQFSVFLSRQLIQRLGSGR